MGIEMKDLSLLEITKVKPWTIYFDYGNKHYLLHGKADGCESIQELYERQLDKNGGDGAYCNCPLCDKEVELGDFDYD